MRKNRILTHWNGQIIEVRYSTTIVLTEQQVLYYIIWEWINSFQFQFLWEVKIKFLIVLLLLKS